MTAVLQRLVVAAIRGYQILLSPFFGSQCRFSPTCSHYAIEAISKYGLIRGVRIAVRRILRCHPWGRGGYDPVP